MTLFKDPNSYNYAFYGAIIVLAVIGSLFFAEPTSPEHLTNKSEEFIETNKERLKYHKFLDNEFFSRKGSWQALIYCWRGGQRSRSLALVLNEIGWRISILKGGYKNYRKLVLDELNDLSKYQFKILQGQTGSAKTKILNCLNNMNAQVIDLENLACHRGSLLGSEINKKQHSQRYFESLLHNAIDKFDCTKPIFIESESSKIGNFTFHATYKRLN